MSHFLNTVPFVTKTFDLSQLRGGLNRNNRTKGTNTHSSILKCILNVDFELLRNFSYFIENIDNFYYYILVHISTNTIIRRYPLCTWRVIDLTFA